MKSFPHAKQRQTYSFINIIQGAPVPEGLDGVDLWNSISNNITSPRKNIIHNIDEDTDRGTWQVNSKNL